MTIICFRARVRRDGSRCQCWWRTASRAGAAGAAGTRVAAAGPARPWRARRRTWPRPRVRTAPIMRPPRPITRSWPASATWWVRVRVSSTARTREPALNRACSSSSSRSAARICRYRAAPGSARHPRRGPRPTPPIPPSQAHGPSPRIRPLGTPYPTTVLRRREGDWRDWSSNRAQQHAGRIAETDNVIGMNPSFVSAASGSSCVAVVWSACGSDRGPLSICLKDLPVSCAFQHHTITRRIILSLDMCIPFAKIVQRYSNNR